MRGNINLNLVAIILLAMIIIVFNSVGYYMLFESDDVPSWLLALVVTLIVAMEFGFLVFTHTYFSDPVKNSVSIRILAVVIVIIMFILSGVGVDRTLWGLYSVKHQDLALSETRYKANIDRSASIEKILATLETKKSDSHNRIETRRKDLEPTRSLYDLQAKKLRKIIMYGGRRCDLSLDCTTRKEVAESTLALTFAEIETINSDIKFMNHEIESINKKITIKNSELESITFENLEYERTKRVESKGLEEKNVFYVYIKEAVNLLPGLDISNPARAYIGIFSYVPYLVYIAITLLHASNLPEMHAKRKDIRRWTLVGAIRRWIKYLILTRQRKVIETEKEVMVEVEKHIVEEKIVFQDREVVKEVPVPYKELIAVPADANIDIFAINQRARKAAQKAQ